MQTALQTTDEQSTNNDHRELVELAALAAGIDGQWKEYVNERACFVGRYPEERNGITGFHWDPRNKDHDCLRLANQLDMDIRRTHVWKDGRMVRAVIAAIPCFEGRHTAFEVVDVAGDADDATRLAVLRAAASVGRRVKAEAGGVDSSTGPSLWAASSAGALPGWTIERDGAEILVVAPSGNGAHVADKGTLAARLLYELADDLIQKSKGLRCNQLCVDSKLESVTGDDGTRGGHPRAGNMGLAQLTLTGKQIRQLVAIEAGADDEVTIAFAGRGADFGPGLYACSTTRNAPARVPLFDPEG